MVQTLPNYSSLSTPPLLLFCESGLSFFETVCQDLSANLGGLRLPLRLGLLLGLLRSARQGFSFGVQGFPELVFASLAHFQTFPTVQSWAMRLFAWPAVFDDPTYPRSRDFIRPRVLALPSQPLPTRRTFFTLRGRANRRVAHVPRDSRKAGQLLRAVAMCEKLPAYWRKLLTAF